MSWCSSVCVGGWRCLCCVYMCGKLALPALCIRVGGWRCLRCVYMCGRLALPVPALCIRVWEAGVSCAVHTCGGGWRCVYV
ncbi:hypothetical protein FKM82_024951 [Ascaphus truei]